MKVTVLLLALGAATMVAAAPLASTEIGKSTGTAVGRTVLAGSDGPDIQIRSGTIIATAADYEMDGTMWVTFTRLEDSTTYLYRSVDHGLSWEYRLALYLGGEVAEKLALVVGEGDSAFVYLFYLDPRNDGDVRSVRTARDGSSMIGFPVAVGPDTIRDFAVCRDYSGGNYWLYAVATNPDPPANSRALRFLRSSTYGRDWAVTDSFAVQVHDPGIAFGAGSWCYFTGVAPLWMGGSVMRWMNRSWCSAGYWTYDYFTSDSDAVADPVVTPAFTLPESLAAVWCVYSQNFNNSGDWDVKYTYSTDGGKAWSLPNYLAGSSSAEERFPDLRNYTDPGNSYVNASYISELGGDRRVYRHYTNAGSPGFWSDTLRINEGNAGTGSEIRPKLCYTPGGPFSGAGCVFVGAGLNGCWWNAPYPVAVEESPKPQAASVKPRPTVVRGVLLLEGDCPRTGTVPRVLLDAAGRRVLALHPGPNDVSRLAPGVYFVRTEDASEQSKVILTR